MRNVHTKVQLFDLIAPCSSTRCMLTLVRESTPKKRELPDLAVLTQHSQTPNSHML